MQKMNFLEELGKICPKAKNGADIYFFGCGKYFEYLRNLYKGFGGVSLEDYAVAFLDNNKNKQGGKFYGKPITNPDSIKCDNSVVLITMVNYTDFEIEKQMMDKGFYWRGNLFDSFYFYKIIRFFIFSNFMKLKNIHNGERCFIIGNGPSLCPKDLDLIINEKTFAMNQIYKIFDKTIWRPSYYLSDDWLIISEIFNEISESVSCIKFFPFDSIIPLVCGSESFSFDNAYYYISATTVYFRPPEFCKPIFGEYPDTFSSTHTSTFICLQLAAFMGFKEIYLLGFDNEYPVMMTKYGEIVFNKIKQHHFSEDYRGNSITKDYANQGFYAGRIDEINIAYQSAREYAESHGIKIFNATRGGKLDVFKRISFDSLF